MNDTKIYGLEFVARHGNVSAENTGRYAYNLNGQIVVLAPKVEGAVYLFNQTEFAQKVTYVTIADADLAFNFSATVNFQWKQLFVKDFYYNYTAPEYPVAVTNCPPEWMAECQAIVPSVMSAIRPITVEIRSLLQNLLASIPLLE